MTCREFMEAAGSLTPLQLRLIQTEDEQMPAHARECVACGRWLESQRTLGSTLQVLRDHTAQREAGPAVEQAVMQAFRMHGFEPVVTWAPHRAAPAAWKLSRLFEFGAYAAVAAALVVGVFLGTRMWRDRQAPPAQIQAQAVAVPQRNSEAGKLAATNGPSRNAATEIARKTADSASTRGAVGSAQQPESRNKQTVATAVDRQGFVALMFCDPLICSGDEQVIRMELPGNASASAEGSGSQPVIADVVVGEDGLVRAMRIVSQ
jgi:hypothetical protein